jgi:hypothetical protein
VADQRGQEPELDDLDVATLADWHSSQPLLFGDLIPYQNNIKSSTAIAG